MLYILGDNIFENTYYMLNLYNKVGSANVAIKSPETISSPELLSSKGFLFLNSAKEMDLINIYRRTKGLNKDAKFFYTSEKFSMQDKYDASKINSFDFNKIDLSMEKKNSYYIKFNKNILNIFPIFPCKIFIKKGLEYIRTMSSKFNEFDFYIQRDDLTKFTEEYNKYFFSNVNKVRSKQTKIECLDVIYENVKNFGIDEISLQLTNSLISKIMEEKFQTKDFKDIYKNNNFISAHSLTMCYLLGHCYFNKFIQLESNIKDMMTASIFHDLNLKNFNYEMAPNLENKLNNHVLTTIALLKKNKLVNQNIQNYIYYHHEGSKQNNLFEIDIEKIPVDCIIFNIIHEFSRYINEENPWSLLKHHFKENLHNQIDKISEFF